METWIWIYFFLRLRKLILSRNLMIQKVNLIYLKKKAVSTQLWDFSKYIPLLSASPFSTSSTASSTGAASVTTSSAGFELPFSWVLVSTTVSFSVASTSASALPFSSSTGVSSSVTTFGASTSTTSFFSTIGVSLQKHWRKGGNV